MLPPLPQVIVTERLTVVRREGTTVAVAEFTARNTEHNTAIGEAQLGMRAEDEWEVSLSIQEAFRLRGYGWEFARALLGLAFAELRASRVVVDVERDNEAGLALVEKLGLNGQGVVQGQRRYITWRAPGTTSPRRRKS